MDFDALTRGMRSAFLTHSGRDKAFMRTILITLLLTACGSTPYSGNLSGAGTTLGEAGTQNDSGGRIGAGGNVGDNNSGEAGNGGSGIIVVTKVPSDGGTAGAATVGGSGGTAGNLGTAGTVGSSGAFSIGGASGMGGSAGQAQGGAGGLVQPIPPNTCPIVDTGPAQLIFQASGGNTTITLDDMPYINGGYIAQSCFLIDLISSQNVIGTVLTVNYRVDEKQNTDRFLFPNFGQPAIKFYFHRDGFCNWAQVSGC